MSQAQATTPGPTRRSARIGSVARSVVSQSAVSVVGTQDTPKATPGRPRALPKVKSRQSTAYGASGRIGAAQELSIPQTGFAEAFQTQRGAAIARTSEERQLGDTRNARAAGRTPPKSHERDTSSQMDYESEDPPSEEEDAEDSEDPDNEEDISAETSKSFGMSHEAGMLRPPTPQNQTPLPSRRDGAATPGAVASGLRRPLGTLADRDRPNSERRIPLTHPSNTLLAEKPSRPPVRESVVGSSTSRFPTARPVQEPAVKSAQGPRVTGLAPRFPSDRPTQPVGIGSGYRAAPLRPNQEQNGGPVAPRSSPPRAVPETEVEPEVEPETAPSHTRFDRVKAVPWLYYALALFAALAALVVTLLASGSPSDAFSTQFTDGWKSFASRFTLGTSTSPTTRVDHSGLKARVDDVELSLKDIQTFIHSLGSEVPDYVVVSRSPSGTMNVSKQFWNAIISRIRKEGPSIEWDTFVQNNQEKLKSALGTEAAIVREDLFKVINSNFNEIAADFDRKLEAHTRILLKDAEKVASREAKRVAVEHARLRSMALSNLIANVELQYGKPNYFSTGLGANIISGITSPTLAPTTAPLLRLLQRVVSPKNNPPLTALQTWDEPGDCWCAAPDESKTGKAQLGIQLGEPMLPTQLTIEHLPRSAAPGEDISSAPQHVELWVQSDEPALVRFAFDGERCEDGPEGWQCLGKVRYDRNGANHVQTFLLDGEAQTPVDKVMLRVTSNWGADHTCLYRVRLHGKGLRPVPENEAVL